MVSILPNWHPFIVHFAIALLSIGSLAMLASLLITREPLASQIRALAHWNLWLGGLFALMAGITGWFAFNSVKHDTLSHLAMLEHRTWALVTISVFVIAVGISLRSIRTALRPSLLLVVICFVGSGLLMATGWRGAELVYRHGLGVLALPNPAQHDHASGAEHQHDHEDEHEHVHSDSVATPAHGESSGVDEHPDQVNVPEAVTAPSAATQGTGHVHADGQVHEH